jgi:class 3 adenylate cyclase
MQQIADWLKKLGMAEYTQRFAENDIDISVLRHLTDQDLKELGISLGHRRKLMQAIGEIDDATSTTSQNAAVTTATPEGGAERRQITVMFVDLVGSTPLSERLDPEEMRDVLSVFRGASAEVVEAHGGHIRHYIGDGILVYFGYPQAHEDDPARAVRAGLGIIEALRAVNERLDAEHGVRLQVRIGVHTGLVVAGEIGAGSARESQAIVGEAPNVAARLQALAQPDTLLIGPATKRLVEGLFVLEELGPQALKGVSGSVSVYRVLMKSEAINAFDLRVVKGLTPLVGRAAELEMLRQRWAQGCDGEMRCVLLVGEPGIGKSRVMRVFHDSLAAEPHETITLHCSPYHQNSAFWPILEWLRRAVHLDLKNYTDDDVGRLEAWLERLALDVRELAPILIAFLGLPTAGRHDAIDPNSASFKWRSLDALVRTVRSMTCREPVLLVLEDAHWIDPSTLEFMRFAQERLVPARLLLLITARPEFRPNWTFPHILHINLDRLSRRDCVAMVDRLTRGQAAAHSLAGSDNCQDGRRSALCRGIDQDRTGKWGIARCQRSI